MAIHDAVLAAAQRLVAGREQPEFTPDEIVRALPHLNAQSVRTHVTSRCCVNATPHHQSRLAYFRKDRSRSVQIASSSSHADLSDEIASNSTPSRSGASRYDSRGSHAE